MARDAKEDAVNAPAATPAADLSPSNPAAAPRQQHQTTTAVVAPSTIINIAVHSLLMVTVPFALFFAAFLGGLDPLISLTGAAIPSREVKSYIGAGLAVLGVNLVIASFVTAAFREDSKPLKQD